MTTTIRSLVRALDRYTLETFNAPRWNAEHREYSDPRA